MISFDINIEWLIATMRSDLRHNCCVSIDFSNVSGTTRYYIINDVCNIIVYVLIQNVLYQNMQYLSVLSTSVVIIAAICLLLRGSYNASDIKNQ